MRSYSQHIVYNPSEPLSAFLDGYSDPTTGKGLDYEYSSALSENVIYFHHDDAFAYTSDLLQFYLDIKNVVNLFRPTKQGNPSDYTELYYETVSPVGDDNYDYFEWDNKYWQNTRFAQIVGFIQSGKILKIRPEIINNIESSFNAKLNELGLNEIQ